MNRIQWIGLGIVGVLATVLAGGCPSVDSRTSNQGGGNLITAASKLAAGDLSTITADEIQIVTDFAIDQLDAPIDAVPDDAAEAVVTFIQDNNLNTIDDIQSLVDNPDQAVVDDNVVAVLGAFAEGQVANLEAQRSAGNVR